MACFADINVSRGSVETYARCGGSFVIHLNTNLPGNLPVKKFVNRLRLDRIMVMSVAPFFGPPCISRTIHLLYASKHTTTIMYYLFWGVKFRMASK